MIQISVPVDAVVTFKIAGEGEKGGDVIIFAGYNDHMKLR
jgi:hypothetical protein